MKHSTNYVSIQVRHRTKFFSAGCAPTEESIQFHSRLPEVEKSRALREAHTKLTDTIGLFENLDNKLVKGLVEK